MKILHIITRLIQGGAQQNTVLSCAGQVASGHQVWLAYGPIYGPEGSLLEAARDSGAELIEVPSMRRAVLPVHDLLCRAALGKLIRQLKPEVVHTHSSKAGILGRSAAWAERVPAVVHTIHGLPFHVGNWGWINRAYVASERRAARRCHKLIGITQAMCDAFLAQGIGRAEQFEVVPSGIDLSQFDSARIERIDPQVVRRRLGIPADAPVIGIVARLDRLKGQDDLLDVLPRLVSRHPALRLLLVGEGWHGEALRQRVRRMGMTNRVIFTGLVPPGQVIELLRAMDVMALPSHQEGQGRTLVEALLCGTAVAGYDVGGIGEVCIEGRTGRLVQPGDRDRLAQCLDELLGDPVGRRALAMQGRRYVAERFDSRKMVADLERIYRQVLSER
jgi:glycosyltransferase involved in cell wall biosynthesis